MVVKCLVVKFFWGSKFVEVKIVWGSKLLGVKKIGESKTMRDQSFWGGQNLSQLMRELEPCSVLLIAKRAGNKQTISPLKQLAKAFQFFRHPQYP